jgi:hypothetical protein
VGVTEASVSPSACRPTRLGAFLQVTSFADASSNAVSLRDKQVFIRSDG